MATAPSGRAPLDLSPTYAHAPRESVRRILMAVSALTCISLVVAQAGAYLEFVLIPPPTAATTGPQGTADLVFGLMAFAGGGLGLVLSIASGIVGLVVASTERRRSWEIAISAAGALVILGLALTAFVLLGLPRNPYHPFTVCLLVPVTVLVYLLSSAGRARA